MIPQNGWTEIQALVARAEQETVDLDFKNKVDPSHGAADKKDREILAQTLTAFANSMGGLAVFGVDCRTVAGVDEASAVNEISGIRRFASDVKTNIPNLAMPRLEDVTVDFIENPAQPDKGVLLVSVGRSERRPHRSEAAGDKRYYKRSGSNTVQMEHFDVEDAFNRMTSAKLEFGKLTTRNSGGAGDIERGLIDFPLMNVSLVTARFPFVEIARLVGGLVNAYGVNDNGHFALRQSPPRTASDIFWECRHRHPSRSETGRFQSCLSSP